jgi:magnesium-dependent phosphatase 1
MVDWLFSFVSECRSKRESPSLFRHAKGIMCALKEKGVDMAIASRSPTPDIARVFIDKLDLQPMFVAQVKLVWPVVYRLLHFTVF